MNIAPFKDEDLEPVIDLSLRAWAPVFVSIREAFGGAIYDALVPDWRVSQRDAVASVCTSGDYSVWVALDGDQVQGFVAVKFDHEEKLGEIYMIAVDPGAQQRGIGVAMTEFAVERMREAGMSVAMVETGGDPGHGPARRTYEKAGFDLVPVARYFKKL